MKPETKAVRTLVRLLDKTTRVMQTMTMRLDVMAFGQRQLERRVGQLERPRKVRARPARSRR